MTDAELAQHYARLGLAPGATAAEVARTYLQRNFKLVRAGEGAAAERTELRAAHDAILAHLEAEAKRARTEAEAAGVRPGAPRELERLLTPPKVRQFDPRADELALFSFDNWLVNTLVPPLLLGFVWVVHQTPLAGLLKGFHVWMHEFGHSTAAWMTGRKATPLPIGWTPIEPDYSPFVYFGLLFLFAVLFVAGWKERKVWPMVAAVALAGLQYFMTWRLALPHQEFWWTFCGIGGEFYLSALMMAAFFVQLPEKFRWGMCRYGFFLIGATCFLNIWLMWRQVYSGAEEIPMGSLVNGEDDEGGDMNKLLDGYGWTKFEIRRRYWLLGNGCLAFLGVVWLVFVLRLNRAADWVVARVSGAAREEDEA